MLSKAATHEQRTRIMIKEQVWDEQTKDHIAWTKDGRTTLAVSKVTRSSVAFGLFIMNRPKY